MRALAYVLLIAVSAASVMVSDLFLRPAEIAGTNPDSWDRVGGFGVMLGAGLLVADFVKTVLREEP